MTNSQRNLEDLWLAEALIERNEDLLIKYPSLEDSLNLLKMVILMEEPPRITSQSDSAKP